MEIAVALVITLVSACALNVGYLIEHSVASQLPPLSPLHPLRSGRLLLGQRRWALGFGIEAIGWLLYVLALVLAPLALVQATAAGGVGILAVMVSRYRKVRLTRLERFGVALSVAGLVLLGVSLAGAHGEGSNGSYLAVGVWLGASIVCGLAVMRLLSRFVGVGPAYGIATGVLFAAGDVSTKAAVGGGGRLAFVAALIGCYAFGTMVLQTGFQHGNPLTTAGIATLSPTRCRSSRAKPSSPSRGRPDGSAFCALPRSGSSWAERWRFPGTSTVPPPRFRTVWPNGRPRRPAPGDLRTREATRGRAMRRIGASSVAPVVAAWKTGDVPLEEYAAGSSGPIP